MLKVTRAIIISQDKILIIQRNSNSEHPLNWEFPVGKLNPDEKVEEFIIREINENSIILKKYLWENMNDTR